MDTSLLFNNYCLIIFFAYYIIVCLSTRISESLIWHSYSHSNHNVYSFFTRCGLSAIPWMSVHITIRIKIIVHLISFDLFLASWHPWFGIVFSYDFSYYENEGVGAILDWKRLLVNNTVLCLLQTKLVMGQRYELFPKRARKNMKTYEKFSGVNVTPKSMMD